MSTISHNFDISILRSSPIRCFDHKFGRIYSRKECDIMDMMNRSSIKSGPAYGNNSTLQATQKNQLREAVNQVSDHTDVQGHHAQKVEGSGAVRNVSLRGYRAIFEGVQLPNIPAPAVVQGNQSSLEAFQAVTGQTPVNDHAQNHKYAHHADQSENAKGSKGYKADEDTKGTKGTKGSDAENKDKKASGGPEKKSVSGEILSKEDQAEVSKLESRDREVRTHEQAHVSAGGQHIKGGIKYDYQKGPDGRSYAVGGHVNIDVSEESSPEATIGKMRQVKRAALAPAEPSSADRAVAAEASKKEQKARQKMSKDRQEEVNGEEKTKRVSIGGSRRKEAQELEKQNGENGENADTQGIQDRSKLNRSAKEAKQSRRSQIQSMPEPPRVRSNMSLSSQSKIKNLSFWR
jgi:hypothetical protein